MVSNVCRYPKLNNTYEHRIYSSLGEDTLVLLLGLLDCPYNLELMLHCLSDFKLYLLEFVCNGPQPEHLRLWNRQDFNRDSVTKIVTRLIEHHAT